MFPGANKIKSDPGYSAVPDADGGRNPRGSKNTPDDPIID